MALRGAIASVAVLALVAGCASTPAAAGEVQPRAAAVALDLAYSFELREEPELAVAVRVRTNGDADGETELALSKGWGGVLDAGADVHDLVVRGAAGDALSLEHPESQRWIVRHAPGEPLVAEYRIDRSAPPGWERDDRHYYQAILLPGLFHLIGNNGLLHPAHLEGPEPRGVRIEWVGFEERGWKVISSLSVGPGPHDLRVPLDEVLHALYLAGDLAIERRVIRGEPLYVAVAGADWSFTPAGFADLCARIVELERAFFDDFDYPHFLISVVPVGARDDRSLSIGGTGLTDSFAMFLMPGAGLAPPAREGDRVGRILAHEMFHHWNGGIVRLEEPEELSYWFSEGFTDFYARRLLLRAGAMSIDDYVASVNEKLAEYWLSPERDASAERVREAFWTDRDVERLPYQRGDLIAMQLDAAIRDASNGRQSLDDLMRVVVRESRRRTEPWTRDELFALAASFAGEEAAAQARATALDGALPPVGASWFAPCLDFAWRESGHFDLGFDWDATNVAGIVTGVRADSAAYAAGLRDGQRLRGGSIEFGRPDRPVEISVEVEGEVRKLGWLPRGGAVEVPTFAFRRSAGIADAACDFL